ncbi:hypothetical protein GCM10018952_33870 [Streptosporangium vulgare]
MAEEPEQVLPEQRAAGLASKMWRAELRSASSASSAAASTGNAISTRIAGEQDVPGEHRQAEHGHARGARMQTIVVMKFTEPEDRAQTADGQADDPQVAADSRRADRVRQRGVREPAEVWPRRPWVMKPDRAMRLPKVKSQ